MKEYNFKINGNDYNVACLLYTSFPTHEMGIYNGLVGDAGRDVECAVVMLVEVLFLVVVYFGKGHGLFKVVIVRWFQR